MRQWTVDAFASAPFRGNAAAVVEPFDAWPDAAWLQALAAENNHSETAFLRRTADPARFELRWFTPAVEVELCGHATLAAGHVLLAELGAAGTQTFDCAAGTLSVRPVGEAYEMDFPSERPTQLAVTPEVARALGAEPDEVWVSRFLLAIFRDERTVRALKPDLAAVMAVGAESWEGAGQIAAAAPAGPGAPYDAVSRFFAPAFGLDEDPVTGSLHCALAPLFAAKLDRQVVRFHQAFPGRGGDLECEPVGERVRLRGRALTVMESVLRIRP